MGVDASMRRVCELVEATAPTAGGPFLWLDPDRGEVPTLEDAHEGPDRLFELAAVQASDAGEGGCIPARLRLACELRIRYRLAGSRHGRAVQQADDVRRLRDALMFAPSAWSHGTTGLLSVLFGEAEAPEIITPDDATGPVHEVVIIPLTLEVEP